MTFSPLVCSLAALCVIFSNGHGCGSTAETPPTPGANVLAPTQQPYTRLLTVNTSGFTEPAEMVLRDENALTAAWRTLHNGIPGNPPPTIDLASRMVVLLALGARNTGGFAIRFDSLVVGGAAGNGVVYYTVTSPDAECMTTQMTTSPIDVVSVPRVDGQLRFERRAVVQHC